jgi:REP element-mobilizing transposase RayT
MVDNLSGRARRVIFSDMVYELTLRVREGLPFVPNRLINLLLKSAMAQASHVTDMSICHYVWMGNHAHIILVAKDPEALTQFYGIVKKSITDFMKRLLGVSRLNLWESTGVHLLATAETVLDRIGYLYSNPAKANLVDRIEEYPGCSSYQSFLNSKGVIDFDGTESVPWVRAKYVQKLEDLLVTPKIDEELTSKIGRKIYYRNKLDIQPNGWMRCFSADPDQAAIWHNKTRGIIQSKELEARELRVKEGKAVLGAAKLLAQEIMSPFIPRKYERGVFVICEDKWKRIEIIAKVKSVQKLARSLYLSDFRYGKPTRWPLGILLPRAPLQACAFRI